MGGFLKTFSKFFTNKTTVTLVGVALGLAVLVGSYIYRVNNTVSPQRVPVAKRDIAATEQITEKDIEYVRINRKFLKDASVYKDTEVKSLVNKYVSVGTSIPKGGMFYKSQIVEKKELPNSIFEEIEDGYTIYQLAVNNKTTYANSIYPGDIIDLWLQTQDSGKLVFGKFISNIRVLAVRDVAGNNVFDITSNKQPAWLLFAVKTDMYRYLKVAEYVSGMKIIPVPTNNLMQTEVGATEYSNDQLTNLIKNEIMETGGYYE